MDDMQQPRLSKIPAMLLVVSAAALLGAVTTSGIVRNSRRLRAVGPMPEVVSTADRPHLEIAEVVIRASRPGNVEAVARLSGINK
jgi:hypothetical protein